MLNLISYTSKCNAPDLVKMKEYHMQEDNYHLNPIQLQHSQHKAGWGRELKKYEDEES